MYLPESDAVRGGFCVTDHLASVLIIAQLAAPTRVFRGIPENRRNWELQFMVPNFVARTGGSEWLSALPTGSKWLSALPTGSK